VVVNAKKNEHEGKRKRNLFQVKRKKCAQKVFDRADVVIALGKLGRGGTEDETVKPLDGVQRV
jgi:hypothetical protein